MSDGAWIEQAARMRRRPEADLRRRIAMSRRLAWELAHPPVLSGATPGVTGFVAATAVDVPLSASLEARTALAQSLTYLRIGSPAQLGQVRGRGGLVLWIHDEPLWTMVLPLEPFGGFVLVCIDDLRDTCMRISTDDPDAVTALETLHMSALQTLAFRAETAAADPARSGPGIWPIAEITAPD